MPPSPTGWISDMAATAGRTGVWRERAGHRSHATTGTAPPTTGQTGATTVNERERHEAAHPEEDATTWLPRPSDVEPDWADLRDTTDAADSQAEYADEDGTAAEQAEAHSQAAAEHRRLAEAHDRARRAATKPDDQEAADENAAQAERAAGTRGASPTQQTAAGNAAEQATLAALAAGRTADEAAAEAEAAGAKAAE